MTEITARVTVRFDRSKLDQIENAARLSGVTTEPVHALDLQLTRSQPRLVVDAEPC